MKFYIQNILLLVIVVFVGCSSGDLIVACRSEFVIITIEVQDNLGEPAVFDSVAVTEI